MPNFNRIGVRSKPRGDQTMMEGPVNRSSAAGLFTQSGQEAAGGEFLRASNTPVRNPSLIKMPFMSPLNQT